MLEYKILNRTVTAVIAMPKSRLQYISHSGMANKYGQQVKVYRLSC